MSFTSTPAPAAPAPAAPMPVDRWRDVYLAALARGVSYAGDFLAATALLLALQERGASGYVVAALLLAAAVPMIVVAPLGGRLADRYDSRALLTVVGLAQAACCAAMVFTSSPVVLIGLAALLSTGLAITQPTFGALTPDMVRPEALPKALAIGQTANAIGMVAAPALAGVLYGQFGLRLPLLLDAVTYLAIVGVGLALRTRRNGPKAQRESAPPAAWRLRDDALLTYLIPAVAIVICVVSSINVIAVFFVRGTLGGSAIAYGLLDGVWMAAMLGGAWLLSRFAGADRRLAVLMMANLALTSGVLLAGSAVGNVGWLALVYVVGGLANGALNTIAQLLVVRRVPGAARGRAIGLFTGVMSAANTIGYATAAPLLDLLGARGAMAVAGGVGVLTVAALAVPALRGAGSPAAAAATP